MKIAYIYQQFTRSAGTERILIDKMNYFAERSGYEVYAVTTHQGDHPFVFPISSHVKRIDLEVRFYDLYRYGRFVRFFKWLGLEKLYSKRLNSILSDVQPDIVIASTYYSYIVKALANSHISACKILESHLDKRYIHDNDPMNHQSIYKLLHARYDMMLLNHYANKYDLMVTLNALDAKDWKQYLKTIIIPNVVHLNPTGHLCDKSSKSVIFVGRLTEQKGIHDLFNIWEMVFMKHPEWSLDIYGDGELYDEIICKANQLDMNIHIHVPSNDIFECYCKSALLVLTSIYEPFGLVIPEAMSCGLPVVAFDCPSGPANIINDGKDGFLIKNRDLRLFANKVCLLIESLDIREKMGEEGCITSQRYSKDHIMPQWESLFKQLIEFKRNENPLFV